jgi:hypothetical protein
MPDYQQGKIYTIRCRTDDTLIYVGSTTQSLTKRWGGHKVSSRNEMQKNYLIYKTINSNWINWYIELYELYPCNSKMELERKEGEIIRLLGTLNVRIEGRTRKEYADLHKEKITIYKKEWYEATKEEKKEDRKKYTDDHKEDIQIYQKKWRENNKEKQKEYNKEWREINKEKKKAHDKIYYEANKDDINLKRKEKYQQKKALKNNIVIL